MSELPRCKNCKFWKIRRFSTLPSYGECEAVDSYDEGFGWSQNPDTLFELEYDALDDTGIWAKLKTGPEFGCIRFNKR